MIDNKQIEISPNVDEWERNAKMYQSMYESMRNKFNDLDKKKREEWANDEIKRLKSMIELGSNQSEALANQLEISTKIIIAMQKLVFQDR
ncbi:hypothetical protein OYT88_11805 [Sporolactobacillus sp. CQH2019]|uniref:hypothetical protein n=1 Tax=Sporolactobacillus sp. CQH2019 TaxID=3023512 RepID=UPI0023688A7C|nr:hypothetical protein [Sporolactobacillus sp. CQH2019]MDD9149238.1 hypothetical protein [Sporolactobacillus sp. CQH2019]